VALPGQVDRSLAATISGEAGDAWQAYWDDGSDTDFLVPFDGSNQFDFRPGRGFWLLSATDWRVSDTFDTVPLTEGAASIDLHDGWNIISNPLDVDVAWDAVDEANGEDLQPIWSWDGSYNEAATFASARSGEAFYFLNDGGLDALMIPYTPVPSAPSSGTKRTARALRLTASRDSTRHAQVRVGTASGATHGLDVHDVVAPPLAFQSVALYAQPESAAATPRRNRLARDIRPDVTTNHAFDLTLHAEPGLPVIFRLRDGDAFPGANVVLIDLAGGKTHNLRASPSVRLRPTHEQTALRILMGDDAFVAAEQDDLLPDTLHLHPNYPNPFRTSTTLTYDLPSATTVQVAVYDVLGRRVQVLVDERKEAGRHTVQWNGQDASGRPLASGLYFVRLQAGDRQLTQRLTLVR
jgi:hypothetical protein